MPTTSQLFSYAASSPNSIVEIKRGSEISKFRTSMKLKKSEADVCSENEVNSEARKYFW